MAANMHSHAQQKYPELPNKANFDPSKKCMENEPTSSETCKEIMNYETF